MFQSARVYQYRLYSLFAKKTASVEGSVGILRQILRPLLLLVKHRHEMSWFGFIQLYPPIIQFLLLKIKRVRFNLKMTKSWMSRPGVTWTSMRYWLWLSPNLMTFSSSWACFCCASGSWSSIFLSSGGMSMFLPSLTLPSPLPLTSVSCTSSCRVSSKPRKNKKLAVQDPKIEMGG